MVRVFAAAGLVLAGFWSSADACSLPEFDPSDRNWTVEQIIDQLPEVVLEGEIIQRDPILGDFAGDGTTKHAKMRVDHAWKGDAETIAILEFGEASASCLGPPPEVGTHVRLDVSPVAPNVFFYYVTSTELLQGPKMEQALREYQRRTNEIKARADAGGHTERLAFAEYLRHHGEIHRALWMFESLVEQQPTDLDALTGLAALQGATWEEDEARATLKRLRELAPKTEEWRGKIARATFEATGVLSSNWTDWSNIESTRHCNVAGSHFDSANFDGAHLHGCLFPGDATFHNASFKGADLRDSDFLVRADVKGALYDCATRLPAWIDPAAAGMINVDGSCPPK
jgi:hypothetical protein